MEEAEDQENEKEDGREDGQQRVEGRVVESQNNHIMSAWGWDEMKCARHTQTWANVSVTLKCVHAGARKCAVWGVLFTHPDGCSRLLSAVNDLTTTSNKNCQSVTLSSLVRKRLQQVALFCDAAHFMSSKGINFDELMSSSGHPTATMMCRMKKTANAISDAGRKESVQVALLQTHGEDGASLLMLRWSLIGVSSVHFCQMCSER